MSDEGQDALPKIRVLDTEAAYRESVIDVLTEALEAAKEGDIRAVLVVVETAGGLFHYEQSGMPDRFRIVGLLEELKLRVLSDGEEDEG